MPDAYDIPSDVESGLDGLQDGDELLGVLLERHDGEAVDLARTVSVVFADL